MWKHYYTPRTLTEALELLDKYAGKGKIIAGGTDLVLDDSALGNGAVDALIDISMITELRQVEIQPGGIRIGSAVNLTEIIASEDLKVHAPILGDAAIQIAGPQIRNIATIGGNVVNASPAADMVPALLVLDSDVEIIDTKHTTRSLPLADFLVGNREVKLRPNEIVTGFIFPKMVTGTKHVFRKVGPRRSLAIAILNLAILLRVVDGRILAPRIALGAVAPTAVHALTVESALDGLSVSKAGEQAIYARIGEDIAPITDFRASRQYRIDVARNLVREEVAGLLNGLSGTG